LAQRRRSQVGATIFLAFALIAGTAGSRAGDRIAILGGAGIYSARLSHLKVIAEIPGEEAPAIWKLVPDARNRVYQTLTGCGARFLLAPHPGPAAPLDPGWTQIPCQPYYLHWLGTPPATQ
jgi:hypothetical protein